MFYFLLTDHFNCLKKMIIEVFIFKLTAIAKKIIIQNPELNFLILNNNNSSPSFPFRGNILLCPAPPLRCILCREKRVLENTAFYD